VDVEVVELVDDDVDVEDEVLDDVELDVPVDVLVPTAHEGTRRAAPRWRCSSAGCSLPQPAVQLAARLEMATPRRASRSGLRSNPFVQ